MTEQEARVMPCATCELCENAIKLYEAYHLFSPKLKVSNMKLRCPKTNIVYEMEGK